MTVSASGTRPPRGPRDPPQRGSQSPGPAAAPIGPARGAFADRAESAAAWSAAPKSSTHSGHRGLRRGLGAPRGTRPRARHLRLAPAPLGLPDHKLTATRSARGSASPTPAPSGVLVVTGIPETADVPPSAQKRLPPAGGPRSTAWGRRSAGSPPRLPRSPLLRPRAHCVRGARCPRTPPCVARPPSEHGHLPPTVTGQLPRPHSSRLPLRPRV